MALACIVLVAALGPSILPESPTTEADLALAEEIEHLETNPIDLNRASVEQLLLVPWLEPFLAHRIVAFRDSARGFRDVRELAHVPGMTSDVFESLLPFVTVGSRRRHLAGELTMRARTDSLAGGIRRSVAFGRATGEQGRWSGVLVAEKDEGEARLDDYLSAGVQLDASRARVVFVDYGFGSGQGLVFSRPEWRSSYLDGRGASTSGPAVTRSAAEGSRLRGVAAQVASGGWRFALLGSYIGRDAELNGNGTVAKLLSGGVHVDSGSLAARNGVREATGGAAVEFRRSVSAFVLTAGFSGYDREFAPADSSGSFFGRALAYGGAGTALVLGDYRIGIELAGASSRGAAALLDVKGDWDRVDVHVALRGRQRGYFAPHGRWTGLSGRDDRLDASARVGLHAAGFSAALSGNTYRDFDLDSIPEHVDVMLRQEAGVFSFGLELERRLRADIERSRRARVRVAMRPSAGTKWEFAVSDAYPDGGEARGVAVSALAETSVGPVDITIVGSRFGITGSGISMRVPEPGAGRTWLSYSSDASAWRVAAASGLRVGRWARLGVKAGCEWSGPPAFDLAVQLDVEAR